MNVPFELHVALRYLLAKRKQAFISVISLISTIGVTVDGVGPAYVAALRGAGIKTFAQLAEQTPEGIADKLINAGAPLIAGHNADTWPRQAKLAAAGDWSALRRYIDSLVTREDKQDKVRDFVEKFNPFKD